MKTVNSTDTNIKLRPINKQRIVITLTMFAIIALTVVGFMTFDYGTKPIGEAVVDTFKGLGTMFTEPHFKHSTFPLLVKEILVTLSLAVLSTLIGAIIALILSLFAAKNLANKHVSNVIKALVAFVRAVPTVLWVLIFAVAAGLGSVAAVIGMTFHTVGYLIKAFSEAFEEVAEGTIEALKASGANWWQIVSQAVIPSTSTYILSWTFLRFEINFAVAVAMGAAAGAGGIGYQMFMASGYYFDIREVGAITYMILFIAILMEIVATRMKTKIHVGEI